MANDPTLPTSSDTANASKQIADETVRAAEAQSKLVELYIRSGNLQKAEATVRASIVAGFQKEQKTLKEKLANLVQTGKMSRDEMANLLKQNRTQEQIVRAQKTATELAKEQAKAAAETAKSLEAQGKAIDAIRTKMKQQKNEELKAIKEKMKDPNELAKKGKAATQGIGEGQVNGREAVSGGMGAAGAGLGLLLGLPPSVGAMLGQIVGNLVMGIKSILQTGDIAAAKLSKYSAQSGEFVQSTMPKWFDGVSKQFLEAKVNANQLLNDTGMSFDEFQKNIGDALASGMKQSEVYGQTLHDTEQNVLALTGAASTMGMDIGNASKIFVNLRNNLRGVGQPAEALSKVAGAAESVAKKNIMTTSEFSSLIGSLSTELADLNVDMSDTIKLTKGILINMKGFGASAEVAKKVTGELTKAFHATSDEWKSFIGSRSGFGGGFVGALFGAQQRGSGGDILKRQVNQEKYLKQMVGTIKDMTASMPDKESQMYMAERMGKEMGLSPEATQGLLKLSQSGFSAGDTSATLKEMVAAQRKTELLSKDWGERLSIILSALVTKWLMGIVQIITGMMKLVGAIFDVIVHPAKLLFPKEGDTNSVSGDISSLFDTIKGLGAGTFDTLKQAGVSNRSIIGESALDTSGINLAGGGGGGTKKGNNGNVKVDVHINMKDNLKEAFDEAHQKTLKALKKTNRYAYGKR